MPGEPLEEPLPSLLPPEGVVATRIESIVRRVDLAKRVDVVGVRGSAGALIAATCATRLERPVVVVTEDIESARRFAADLTFYRGPDASLPVLVLQMPEGSPYADVSPDRRGAMSRLGVLHHLALGLPFFALVAPASALSRKVMPRRALLAASARVRAESEIDREALLLALSDGGYLRAPVVEDPGSFSVRGSLIDVWPAQRSTPVRLELYGDLVVAIKAFDPHEQRTLDGVALAEVHLPPAREALLTKDHTARAKAAITEQADRMDWPTLKTRALLDDVLGGRSFFGADAFLPAYYERLEPLFSYLTDDAIVLLEEPTVLSRSLTEAGSRAAEDVVQKVKEPHFGVTSFHSTNDELASLLAQRSVVTLQRTGIVGRGEFDERTTALDAFESVEHPLEVASLDNEDLGRAMKSSRASKGKVGALAPLARRIQHFEENGLRVVLAARTETQADRLALLLKHQGVRCRVKAGSTELPTAEQSRENGATIVTGSLARGTVLPAEGLALVTEEEIFGARAHRRAESATRKKKAARAFVEDLRTLAVGDLVVHVEHGIGRYHGLVHRDVGSLRVDLLVVEYAGGDKLYLPVYRLNQIEKYSGGESASPKLDRLGGVTFSKTKARAEKAVRQMADELLRLYAERKAVGRPAFASVGDEYRAFEATFPYDETADQAAAIDEVNVDLDRARPMDRLVCGDVGFGKTEVALRAAFRVAHAGRQVAVLCPTTVLAQQHLRTFEARLADYAITIRAMSRFQTKKEQDDALRALKEGKCDIVIGTHRLLSKDVHFKDLGLLVVDEEQRFGVTHKERIKALRTSVDVLTLSATPIPRTLQMAVAGMRDLSLITTPPADRRAVRTVVTREDPRMIKEAIERELSRGGQVFYVYNRIEGLYERAQRLKEILPSARIAVAHGQMTKGGAGGGESALEKTMLDFVDGKYDVLCATAIIESGLDIPRANTIIIDRADLFGLAQLYQLRGRVGRAKERAYCYLVVPPPNQMSDESRARIEALERHTELGSGFKVASLDLELRGAGDLLGAEQSGTVATVGFELFCRMLEDAVHELSGETVVHDVDTELSFDVPALLPEDYVEDTGVRLSLYKRLASAADAAEVTDVASEMEDRFGPPPEDAKRLVHLMTIKTELRKLRALGCEANARVVTLHLREDTPLDSRKILELVRSKDGKAGVYRLTPDMRLSRRFDGHANGITNVETMLDELSRCYKS